MPRHIYLLLTLTLSVSAGLVACARRCPSGTTLRGQMHAAQWCQTRGTPTDLSAARELQASATSTAPPEVSAGSLEGPVTTWSPNQTLRSHGSYASSDQSASRADGLWTFWYDNGKPRSQGNYLMGQAVGCFSLWNEEGRRETAIWDPETEQFLSSECEGPSGRPPAALARYARAQGDVALSSFVSTGGFGLRNSRYLVREPQLAANIELEVRKYFGRFRIGGRGALRGSEDGGHGGQVAALSLAAALPSPLDGLGLELSAALGIQRVEADVALKEDPSYVSFPAERFTTAYAALDAGASYRLHPYLDLVATLRAEGGVPESQERSTLFCIYNQCAEYREDTWEVGGHALAAGLGLRLLLR